MAYGITDLIGDVVAGTLEYAPDDAVATRRALCDGCQFQVMGVCTVCGCIVATKTALAETECPLGYWLPCHKPVD